MSDQITADPEISHAVTPRKIKAAIPWAKIEKMMEGKDVSKSEQIYVFPTVIELDATEYYAIYGTPLQGFSTYFSYAILPESILPEIYPALIDIPNWRLLFRSLADDEDNKKKYPIMLLDGPPEVQYHFCNRIGGNLLNHFINQKKRAEVEAQQKKNEASTSKITEISESLGKASVSDQ